jgi:hypothetical protein
VELCSCEGTGLAYVLSHKYFMFFNLIINGFVKIASVLLLVYRNVIIVCLSSGLSKFTCLAFWYSLKLFNIFSILKVCS